MPDAPAIPAPSLYERANASLLERAGAEGRRRTGLADGGTVGPGDIPLAFKNALHRAGKTPAEKATDVARDFVAMALVQPTLKMMRESNHAPPPFGPGEAEKKFGSMLDAQQARSIVGSKNFPLIDAVRDRLMGVPSAPAVWPAHGAREVTAIPPAQLAAAWRKTHVSNKEPPRE